MTIGAFDFNAFDNTGFWTGDTAAVAAPVGAGGGGAAGRKKQQEYALIAPFIRWGRKKDKKKPAQVREVASAIRQAKRQAPEPLPVEFDEAAIAELILEQQELINLRNMVFDEFVKQVKIVTDEIDDEEVLLLALN